MAWPYSGYDQIDLGDLGFDVSQYQGAPAATVASANYAPLDLGNWSPANVSGLQNLFTVPTTPSVLDQYIAEQAAKGNEVVSLNPYQGSGLDAINANIWNAYNQFDPNNPGATTGIVYRLDTGNDIGVPDEQGGFTERNSGVVVLQPGQTYTMTDKTGEVIATASTPEEMQELVNKSEEVPYYNLTRTDATGSTTDTGAMLPNKTDAGSLGSMLVNMAALALPAVGGAALGPVLAGGLGTSAAVGTGLGTALGTAAAGTAAGKSIEDILLQSALAGIASGGLAALTTPKGIPDIGDLEMNVIDKISALPAGTSPSVAQGIVDAAKQQLISAGASQAVINSFGQTMANTFPTVVGNVGGAVAGIGGGALAGGVTGAVTGAATGAASGAQAPAEDGTTVYGKRIQDIVNIYKANPGISITSPLLKGYTAAEVFDAAKLYNQETAGTEVVATQEPAPPPPAPPPPVVVPPVSGIGDIVVTAPETPPPPEEPAPPPPVVVPPTTPTDIVVEGDVSKPVQDEINRQETVVPPIDSVTIPPDAGNVTPVDKKGLSTLDYIRLGLLAPKLIGGVVDLLKGEDNTIITPESSRINYKPLNRQQNVAGIGGKPFDVFTYGQNVPGAQTAEYEFFKPYSLGLGQQAYTPVSSRERYTQADVDAANANLMANYNTQLQNFNAYQDTLANQVAAGVVTPEQAQGLAQQYATGLGYSASLPAKKEGGEIDGDGEMSDEMVRHLIEWNKGNGHRGPGQVKGIGSGQEDLIPAWLSDGEYVWSAQDVADLGDGSTDEGVRRLDKMRQMVRGRAGRKDVKKIAKPQQGIDAMLKAVGGKV